MTSLQPRTRTVETRPAQPGLVPVHLEHEYSLCRRRKRQVEFIELLEKIDAETPTEITLIHLICDNLSVHHGKKVRAWIERHPRFKMHFAALEQAIVDFMAEWNELAHPFKWTTKSFDKVLA
jgi:hypothetical protein